MTGIVIRIDTKQIYISENYVPRNNRILTLNFSPFCNSPSTLDDDASLSVAMAK